MFIDFRDQNTPAYMQTDICVVGAGAAGISFALRMLGTKIRVCLIESGGFEPNPATQSLYAGSSVGQERADPLHCRLRYFGGTTNHWQGWCSTLQARDFKRRNWVANSGWPISSTDLEPYYSAARKLVDIGSGGFEAESDDPNQIPASRDDVASKVLTRYWRYSPPTRFGSVYRNTLLHADNIDIILNANLTGIETSEDGCHVNEITVESLQGRLCKVRARYFVLACGALENARILLQCNDQHKSGLGNRSGALGRYFMQHPERKVASIITDDAHRLLRMFKRVQDRDGWKMAHLACTDRIQEKHGLLNAGFDIQPRPDYGPGYTALRNVFSDIASGYWPDDLDTRVWAMLSDFGRMGTDLYNRITDTVSSFDLVAHCEQQPNPSSRVTLTRQTDQFGLPQLRVDWKLTEADKRSIFESTLRVGEALTAAGLGRLKLEDWLLQGDNYWPEYIWSGCHHMGTTRMSDDPARGVVDRNARLHEVRNLYIAGSSIFPTGGYVTPTLTIVALTLRLADHLKSVMYR